MIPLWKHQEEAVRFVHNLWWGKRHGAMLAMAMGCIAGDAEIVVNRGGNARRHKLRDLYHKFHGGETIYENQIHRWDPNIECRTASLIEGELRLNRIIDVIDQGTRPVLKIQLRSGKFIRLTTDHEIATPGGWIIANNLEAGSEVLTNGIPSCRVCGSTFRVAVYHYAKHRGLCRSCIAKIANRQWQPVKDKIIDKDGYVRLYRMSQHPRHNRAGQVYEHIVVMEDVLGRPITRAEHVHHKNGVRHDNRPDNLEVMPATEHHRHHGQNGGYLHLDSGDVCFIPKIDTVAKIEADGESDVYDLVMDHPGHNFVANGIIVHNCGKSRVAVALASGDAQHVLIVCPLRVVEVWRQQFERFAPGEFRFLALDDRAGSVAAKTRQAQELYHWSVQQGTVIVIAINYDSARMQPFASWAASRSWDLTILDESHRIKSPRGRTALWAAKVGLMSHRRLALTGTPMPHQPTDIWSQFRFLDPFQLERTFFEFRQRYAIMGGYLNKQVIAWQNLDELEARFRELAFRVDDSVLDLPPEMDETRSAELAPGSRRLYREMETEAITWISEAAQVTAANALVRLLRLAQITSGTVTDETGHAHRIDDAKEEMLRELLEDLAEPVVVFCRFRPDLEAVHRAAQQVGLSSSELSGTRDELARWQEAEGPPVLAVQIQAGGVGIDLTRARIAIYYSIGFSLADYLQSRARIRRPPQQRPCTFYHLEIRHSIDEYIRRAVTARQDLVESVVDGLRKKGMAHVVTG